MLQNQRKYLFRLLIISLMSIPVLVFAGSTDWESCFVSLPDDSLAFQLTGADSVFIFSEDLAVTAFGDNILEIGFMNEAITGDKLPPTARLRNPLGAILYRQGVIFPMLPVIDGRFNTSASLDRICRNTLLGFRKMSGQSEKGGVKIRVWQKKTDQSSWLLFFDKGRLLSDGSEPRITSWTFPRFDVSGSQLKGVWIDLPETGNHDLLSDLFDLMQKGPVLTAFWDGLGWDAFESAYLSGVIGREPGDMEMVYSLYPPVTKTNYRAMLYGLYGDDHPNLFQILRSENLSYRVLEGEKMMYPVPGELFLHAGDTPEVKDETVFQSAQQAVEQGGLHLLFVHFHGLDDLNHEYGPDDSRTKKHLADLWEYHRYFLNNWMGPVVLIADHGVHPTPDGKGDHGDFIFQDMAVPRIISNTRIESEPAISPEQARRMVNLSKQLKPYISKTHDPVFIPGELSVIIGGDTLPLSGEQHAGLFNHPFTCHYIRKGNPYPMRFQGAVLQNLTGLDFHRTVLSVTAASHDGQQVLFSGEDYLSRSLAIGFNPHAENPVKAFTLFPVNDSHPARMVKMLKWIKIDLK